MIRGLILLCVALAARAADYPFALQPEETAKAGLWVSTNSPGIQALRVVNNGRLGSIKPVLVDELPHSTEFKLDSITAGHVEDLQPARFPITLEEGKPVRLEVFANRIGSQLDPVLRLLDKTGTEIDYRDDGPFTGRDAVLNLAGRKAGDYVIEIRDVAHGAGGNHFFALKAETNFRNRERPPAEDSEPLNITLPVSLRGQFDFPGDRDEFEFSVENGERWIFSAVTREEGSPCDAGLKLFDGKGAEAVLRPAVAESIGPEARGASITNTFSKAGKFRLQVREISKQGGPGYPYRLEIRRFEPGVLVTTELESVSLSKDGEAKLKFFAQRFGYDGPIKLLSSDLPEGLALEGATIPEKKGETEVKLKGELAQPIHSRWLAETDGRAFPVSTEPALRKLFPLMMFPPRALDGWIVINPASK